MRGVRLATWAAFCVLAGLGALNWRAHLQTQQKLDALTAALAERPAVHEPAPAASIPPAPVAKPAKPAPRELEKITFPPYMIDAPDQLTIEVVQRSQVPDVDVQGMEKKGPDGKVLTRMVTDRLPVQPLSGSFLVRPDGTVGLGYWGSVRVAGLTLEQAAGSIRAHLAGREPLQQLGTKPENLTVIVDVAAYNSKKYYVITDGAGGEKVFAFPCSGNECVLDALSEKKGLPDVGGRRKVWIARPASHPDQPPQVLPVDWTAITRDGVTSTNYQLMPGDRVHVTPGTD